VTRKTLAFDLLFGFVLPLAGVVLDRTVIAHHAEYDTVSGAIWVTPYVQLLTLTGVLGLLLWHGIRSFAGWWVVPLSGVLGVGAAWATFVACFAVPMSALGFAVSHSWPEALVVCLGLLTPATAWVYVRNTARAVVAGGVHASNESRMAIFALVGLLALATNFAAGRLAKAAAWRAQETVLLDGDSNDVRRAVHRLRLLWVFPGVRPRRIEGAAVGDKSVPRKPHARRAFERICNVDCDEVEERRAYDSF